MIEGANQSRENLRALVSSRSGSASNGASPIPGRTDSRTANHSQRGKSVAFTPTSTLFRYPPAVWNEEEEDVEDDYEETDEEGDEEDEDETDAAETRLGETYPGA